MQKIEIQKGKHVLINGNLIAHVLSYEVKSDALDKPVVTLTFEVDGLLVDHKTRPHKGEAAEVVSPLHTLKEAFQEAIGQDVTGGAKKRIDLLEERVAALEGRVQELPTIRQVRVNITSEQLVKAMYDSFPKAREQHDSQDEN